MFNKKQLITLGDDGELALKAPDGSIQEMPIWQTKSGESYVYLVMDCSGSMVGKKLQDAKNGALDFAKTALRDNYFVGLISFNDDTSHLCSPVSNFQDISAAINRLYAQGGTNLAPAIQEVISRLESKRDSTLAMVIVTDGLTSNPQLALRAAENAKRLGITILAIGTDDADHHFLSQLASGTELAKKVNNESLEEAISDIAKLLPPGDS